MSWRLLPPLLALSCLAGCGPNYVPDTNSAGATQQATKVEHGIVAGVRNAGVSAAGTVGTATGAAAGGSAGSQLAPSPLSAFTGASKLGATPGSTVEPITGDTTAFEYIIRKANGDLVSVTQKDKTPLAFGQRVLVIAGSQARVVPDDTVPPRTPMAATAGTPSRPEAAPAPSADTRPAEPEKADTPPPNPATATPQATLGPVSTTPAAAPPAPAPAPVANPADTPDQAS